MNYKIFLTILILILPIFAQINSYTDDFEDGIITGWTSDLTTYNLSETNGELTINYHRVASSNEWHNFGFTTSENIDVSETPEIYLRLKSNIETNLSVKPIYSNGNQGWFDYSLSESDGWQEITVHLNSNNYNGTTLSNIYFYLDGGSTTEKSGVVSIDEFRIGNGVFELEVYNLRATALGEDSIDLDWECNDTLVVKNYKIYRDIYPGFTLNNSTLIDSSSIPKYSDTELEVDKRYYYRVIAVDTSSTQSEPSNETSALTFVPGSGPTISVARVNGTEIGVYEKFEIEVEMPSAVYTNPYNPEEIDLKAIFTSPTDSVWVINGFYDDFNNQDLWKIRFSPNETGIWNYYLTVTDMSGTGQSVSSQFTAIESEHKGWIRPSKINPHYFVHDNGESYFGVGLYYPWNMNAAGMDRMQNNGSNLVGFWNIMYDEGDIIESMKSGLGKYDQNKCGRIDEIIELSEERDMKAMFAIWPHDLLSHTVWYHQWHQNPYSTICEPEEFYADEEAWEYQKRQYRYLIARWGYSRGLGIWEIVNEINGTDGWQNGYSADANMWTERVATYLRENDPYKRPNTANQSGGQWWPEGYEVVDIPNVHMYESGWSAEYPSNPHRSSVHLYKNITRNFWNGFDKPAVFGEAGYKDIYGAYDPGTSNYTTSYHNTLWSSWANGISATPIWWDYPLLSDEDFLQLKAFGKFIADNIDYLDFANINYESMNVSGENCDVFAMTSDTSAFGWIRQINGSPVSGHTFTVNGLENLAYSINYYDTWTGDLIVSDILFTDNGSATQILPLISSNKPDVAFIIKPEEFGDTPYQILMNTNRNNLLNDGESTAELKVFLKDEEGKFCGNSTNEITFSVIGNGSFTTSNVINASDGIASIVYQAPTEIGLEKIIATSPGLISDTVEIDIASYSIFDDFEKYLDSDELGNYWKAKGTSQARVYLEKFNFYEGKQSMKFNYKIGNSAPPYSAIYREISDDLSKFNYLGFWYKPTGKNNQAVIRLTENNGSNWDFYFDIEGNTGEYKELSFEDFTKYSGTSDSINLADISEISINILKGNGEYGESIIFFDSFKLLTAPTTVAIDEDMEKQLNEFKLNQNYPNPFNPETTIEFQLQKNTNVKLQIFDMRGNLVETLANEYRSIGKHDVIWNAANQPSGIYIYKLISDGAVEMKKCALLK